MLTETGPSAAADELGGVESLLSIRSISKKFGATQALDSVSIELCQGEIHCLLGENGAGKSTIGKIVGGLYRPDEGILHWRGNPVHFRSISDSRHFGVALVFQELSLAPHLSVRSNIQLGKKPACGLMTRIKHHEESEVVAQALARLGLSLDIEQPVGQLSVATQQMVEIAKALMNSPKLVVFDEPTAMLGAVEKQMLFNVLKKLRDEGTAIVLITHHIDDVMAVGDRVSIMRNGKLVDSFPKSLETNADHVLERLTGKKVSVVSRERGVAENSAAMLTIDGLRKRDGSYGSLTVRRGEVAGFYGVVGSGAESIARALVGIESMKAASMLLDGEVFCPQTPAKALSAGVSYLPSGRASNGIFATLSIRENLNVSLAKDLGNCGIISTKREYAQTDSLLGRFGVKYQCADDPITSLSGGNQQKVLMARAIARAQKVLVLEEPTAGIDIEAKNSIHMQIRRLTETGVSVIVVSSDLLETIHLCDTVYTMYGGQVVGSYNNPTLDDQPSIVSDVLGKHSDN